MIEQVWRNLLISDEQGEPLVNEEERDDVISLMVKFKIDPQKFSGNLCVMLAGGMASMFNVTSAEQQLPSTKSIHNFVSIGNRPKAIPLWLIAGFPDFVMWFQEKTSVVFDPNCSEEKIMSLFSSLFELEIEDVEEKLFNGEGTHPLSLWLKAINKYANETSEPFETAVKEGSSNDPYVGSEFLKMLGEESNFTLIASMTTKYYLELKKSYKQCFPDETSLLSIAGMLDANAYVFASNQIKHTQIINIAKNTVNSKERLLDFIIQLEALIMSVDAPEIPYEDVQQSCESQTKSIKSAIKKTIDSYTRDEKVSNDVRLFMKMAQCSEIRKDAGVVSVSIVNRIKSFLGGKNEVKED